MVHSAGLALVQDLQVQLKPVHVAVVETPTQAKASFVDGALVAALLAFVATHTSEFRMQATFSWTQCQSSQ